MSGIQKTMLRLGEKGSLIPTYSDEERPRLKVRTEGRAIIEGDARGVRGLSKFLTISSGAVVVRLNAEDGTVFGRLLREWKASGVDLDCRYDFKERAFHAPRTSFTMINELLLDTFRGGEGEKQRIIADARYVAAVRVKTVETQYSKTFFEEAQEELGLLQWDFDAFLLSKAENEEWNRKREEFQMGYEAKKRRTLRQR